MTDVVAQAFRTTFQLADDFDITDDLAFEGIPGWDSVGLMMLVTELEGKIGRTLDMDEIIGMDSVKTIREIIAKKQQ